MSRPQGARTLRMFSVIELNESEMNMPSVFALPAKYVDARYVDENNCPYLFSFHPVSNTAVCNFNKDAFLSWVLFRTYFFFFTGNSLLNFI